MNDAPKRDWFKFWLHFFCGAILGAFLGFRVWGKSLYALSHSWLPGIIIVSGAALACGIIAGLLSNTGWDE